MKLYIHVGLPKCASTSLQAALYENDEIYFPRHGLHHFEHIAIPLKLKGIDKWTSQWFSQDWVDREYKLLIEEIYNSNSHVVVSSERLADIPQEVLDVFLSEFAEAEIEILYLFRPADGYVRSMWRHAVFRHDMSEGFDSFKKGFSDFDPLNIGNRFAAKYKINMIDISKSGWSEQLSEALGFVPDIQNENVSAPYEACYFLQQIHQCIGTEKFKAYYSTLRKEEFAKLFADGCTSQLEEFEVPIVRGKQT